MTEQRARELLKPCPFCGGEARLSSVSFPMEADCTEIGVSCADCEVAGYRVIFDQHSDQETDIPVFEAEAIRAWNIRVDRSTPFAESAKSPSDSVRRLVITARELLDESDDGSDAARALDRALEDFAGAVPFADESNDIRALRKAAPPPAIAEAAFAALDGSAVTRLLTKFAQAADFSNARDCQIYGALLAYSDARAALQSSEADNG